MPGVRLRFARQPKRTAVPGMWIRLRARDDMFAAPTGTETSACVRNADCTCGALVDLVHRGFERFSYMVPSWRPKPDRRVAFAFVVLLPALFEVLLPVRVYRNWYEEDPLAAFRTSGSRHRLDQD